MRIALCRSPVCCPARMTDTGGRRTKLLADRFAQLGEVADCPDHLDGAGIVVEQRDAG